MALLVVQKGDGLICGGRKMREGASLLRPLRVYAGSAALVAVTGPVSSDQRRQERWKVCSKVERKDSSPNGRPA
jgi:hypothetical protein